MLKLETSINLKVTNEEKGLRATYIPSDFLPYLKNVVYDDLRCVPDEDAQQEQLSPQDILSSLLRALFHWR